MEQKKKRKKQIPLNHRVALEIMLTALILLAGGAMNNTGYIIGNYAMQTKSSITYVGRCVYYEKEDDPPTRFSTDKTYFILHLDNGISVGVYRSVFDIDALGEKGKDEILSQELEFSYIPVHPFLFNDQAELLLTMKSQKQEFIAKGHVQAAYHEKLSGFMPIFVVFSSTAALVVIIPFVVKCATRNTKKKHKMHRKAE